MKIFFLNATKVVKINNLNPKFKLRIRMRIPSGSVIGFGLPSLRGGGEVLTHLRKQWVTALCLG